MEYTSFIKHLARITHIPMAVCNGCGEVLHCYSDRDELMGILDLDSKFLLERRTAVGEKNPWIEEVAENIFCGLVTASADLMTCVCVIGPVSVRRSGRAGSDIVRKRFQVPPNQGIYITEYNKEDFFRLILMIYEFMTGESKTVQELITDNVDEALIDNETHKYFYKNVFERHENNWGHNSYSQEQREQDSIRNGDLEGLKRALNEPMGGQPGILASDELRSTKNLCIVVIAISTRSALAGGLNVEQAYSLSDSYICQIEDETDIMKMSVITRNAEIDFAKRVRELKDKKRMHPLIDKCLNLIFRSLHSKITVGELARELDVNPDYLSKVFHEKMGMTIVAYCKQEKVRLAQNQLVYSDYTLEEIAYYLGFASQSHFGKTFKEITGMTPGRYRETYAMARFIDDFDEKIKTGLRIYCADRTIT